MLRVNGNRHKWRLKQALETVGAIRLMLKARLFPRLILLPTIGTDDPQCRHFTASTRISSTQNGHFRMAAWPCLDCRQATTSPMRDTTPQARATSAKTSAPAMVSTSASASRIQLRIRQGTIQLFNFGGQATKMQNPGSPDLVIPLSTFCPPNFLPNSEL